MRIRQMLLAGLFLGIAGAASAQTPTRAPELPSFEFRGHRIGDDALALFPYLEDPQKLGLEPYCTPEGVPGYASCWDRESYTNFYGVVGQRLGDVPFGFLKYLVYERRIVGVTAMAHINLYPKLRGMLIGKYGEPAAEHVATVQSRAGATFDNMETEWRFKEGTLRLQQRGWDVDHCLLAFENPAVRAKLDEVQKAADGTKGRQAF